jgi:hypothetical protein
MAAASAAAGLVGQSVTGDRPRLSSDADDRVSSTAATTDLSSSLTLSSASPPDTLRSLAMRRARASAAISTSGAATGVTQLNRIGFLQTLGREERRGRVVVDYIENPDVM